MSNRSRRIQGESAQPLDANVQAQQAQEKFNQLVQEVRLLESYYQEILSRQQAMSAGILETRAALEALDGLSTSEKTELLIPVGGGTLLPVSAAPVEKLVVSLGAGVAVEKDVTSTKAFLTSRRQELEKAVSTLEEQRKEIGSRLEAQKTALQRMTQ
ncbi:MAG: prefoldin subunit alpha [Nitrososphaerales archaeon]